VNPDLYGVEPHSLPHTCRVRAGRGAPAAPTFASTASAAQATAETFARHKIGDRTAAVHEQEMKR
jgi:hypothetical protein